MDIKIRPAQTNDHTELTEISFASKRHWNYPEEYFEIWKAELVITPRYINENTVFCAEIDSRIAGYYSLVCVKKDFYAGESLVTSGWWLEHMFIRPEYIGKGIGKQLFNHMIGYCKSNGIREISIFADPNAKGFYDKMGAEFTCLTPSNIKGRDVCLYRLQIK